MADDGRAGDERERRLAKLDTLRAGGTNPYPVRFDRTHTAVELQQRWGDLEPGAETGDVVRVAGRIMLLRRQGKLTFATLRDRVLVWLLTRDGYHHFESEITSATFRLSTAMSRLALPCFGREPFT